MRFNPGDLVKHTDGTVGVVLAVDVRNHWAEVASCDGDGDVTVRSKRAWWPANKFEVLNRDEKFTPVLSFTKRKRDAALLLMRRVEEVTGAKVLDDPSLHNKMYARTQAVLRDFGNACARENTMPMGVFIHQYGFMLACLPTGSEFTFVSPDGSRQVRLVANFIEGQSVMQFMRRSCPYGDPLSPNEAAEKLYSFFTGVAIDESVATLG